MKNYPKRLINSQNDFEGASISDMQKNRLFGDKLKKTLREKARAVKVVKTGPGLLDIFIPTYPETQELLDKWDRANQKEKVIIREMEENKEYIARLTKEVKKKTSGSREEIQLKTYGVIIDGKYIHRKGLKDEEIFTNTEEKLIYYLYANFVNNKEDCLSTTSIAKTINTSSGYIKNMINSIHKKIGERISRDHPPKINFIQNKLRRGYRLNSKILK